MKSLIKFFSNQKFSIFTGFFSVLLLVLADSSYAVTLGSVAGNISASFTAIGKLITGGSYIAGLGFAVGAIMKFKQHKDNPTQIPIGTPASLVFIAAALLFFPTMMKTIGSSMFGTSGKTAGATGTTIGGTT